MSIKLVMGFPNGRTAQKEIENAKPVFGKKIGDKFSGDELGLEGYEFEIKGGSDNAGFPMRSDMPGFARKPILAVQGIGLKKIGKGIRVRKTVCGAVVSPNIVQLNVKVLKVGKENVLPEPKKEEAPAAEAPAKEVEAPAKEEKPAESATPAEAPAKE